MLTFFDVSVLAYLGPEVVLPLASVVAAAVGTLLIGWKWVLNLFRSAFRFVFRRGKTPEAEETSEETELEDAPAVAVAEPGPADVAATK